MCSLLCITWSEDYTKYESYVESKEVWHASNETEAKCLAEELVDVWASYEKDAIRFVRGRDHGAYVDERWHARGIRVSILSD